MIPSPVCAIRGATIERSDHAGDRRLVQLTDWLRTLPALDGFALKPASVDASFRRYFRVVVGDDSYIAMDAPPELEDCMPFVTVASYLGSIGLNAPDVLASRTDDGFLLLSDFGTRVYLDVLMEEPLRADELYGDALDALAVMQRDGEGYVDRLPPYDDALLRFELSLFSDWLCGRHLGITMTAGEKREWDALCNLLVNTALDQSSVFVHRDYHSRNLMVTEEGNPGILDFQDAVAGPLCYDLVSLLKDCYVTWDAGRVSVWALDYFERLPLSLRERIGTERFLRDFALTGVHRHLKAAGIFARLKHRDGKVAYMNDVPRALAYIPPLADDHPELAFLAGFIDDRVFPALARRP